MPASMVKRDDDKSALPPLPDDHGFEPGDRVEIPVYSQGKMQGIVEEIDVTYAGKRYHGLAVLGDDGRYYELDPHLAKKLTSR